MDSLTVMHPGSTGWSTGYANTGVQSSFKPNYIFRITKDEDGRFVVTCTNLQGVITDGTDEKEALKNGIEALNAILDARHMDKEYNIIEKHY